MYMCMNVYLLRSERIPAVTFRQLSPQQHTQNKERRGRRGDSEQKEEWVELFKGVTQLKIPHSVLFNYMLFCVFSFFFVLRQSYQTGIHHKSTSSPELGQLLAAQRDGKTGEQSARHQVEQGGLTHLHHGQRHECDEQADTIRW